jgi:NADH-quinone oxidoreductase subunit A
MQSDQLHSNFITVLLAAGFVVGTIIVSGKLGPKRKSEIKKL